VSQINCAEGLEKQCLSVHPLGGGRRLLGGHRRLCQERLLRGLGNSLLRGGRRRRFGRTPICHLIANAVDGCREVLLECRPCWEMRLSPAACGVCCFPASCGIVLSCNSVIFASHFPLRLFTRCYQILKRLSPVWQLR